MSSIYSDDNRHRSLVIYRLRRIKGVLFSTEMHNFSEILRIENGGQRFQHVIRPKFVPEVSQIVPKKELRHLGCKT